METDPNQSDIPLSQKLFEDYRLTALFGNNFAAFMALDQLSQLTLADAQYNLDNAFELTLEFTTDLNERFQ
ncbi:hypothetical protein KC909_05245 [Candidatus Dojkabacteria bacterium]|uniref:Uncharacterized protein n=1 Tax=Candidatus Dojkabacteria bacterium TaxID=2099670 RepID=A0A955L6H0_9BACT|nr:hypothetical protein [Candidatus Dojkabacteria bacterium]